MTDREKLVELLGGATVEQVVCSGDGTPVSRHVCRVVDDGDAECLADHLIANGVTVQKWIPASEPPKEGGYYMVMIRGAEKATELLYSDVRAQWEDDECDIPYPVTHWMPLPPKEREV